MKLLVGIFAIIFVARMVTAEKMRFDHHKVYKLEVKNDEQMNVLRELEETPNGEFTFFDSPRVGHFVEVVVPPQKLYEFKSIMVNSNIIHELKFENLQT